MDPDDAATDQPYVYTGDDPLNATDPLGLKLTTAAQALLNADAELLVRLNAAAADPTKANLAAVNALSERVTADASVASASVTLPVFTTVLSGGIFTATVNASVTFAGPSVLGVNINATDGDIELTGGSQPTSVSSSSALDLSLSSGGATAGTTKTLNYDGDTVTTTFQVTVTPSGTNWEGWGWAVTAAGVINAGLQAGVTYLARPIAEECATDIIGCFTPVLAP